MVIAAGIGLGSSGSYAASGCPTLGEEPRIDTRPPLHHVQISAGSVLRRRDLGIALCVTVVPRFPVRPSRDIRQGGFRIDWGAVPRHRGAQTANGVHIRNRGSNRSALVATG